MPARKKERKEGRKMNGDMTECERNGIAKKRNGSETLRKKGKMMLRAGNKARKKVEEESNEQI